MGEMLNTKELLLQYLSAEHSPDYWSDVGMSHGIDLAKMMSRAKWAEIHQTWRQLDPLIQVRIAEISSEASDQSPEIVPMLISMLSSHSPDLIEASIDSLNSICQNSPEQIDKERVALAITGLNPKGLLVRKVLDSLRKHISAHP